MSLTFGLWASPGQTSGGETPELPAQFVLYVQLLSPLSCNENKNMFLGCWTVSSWALILKSQLPFLGRVLWPGLLTLSGDSRHDDAGRPRSLRLTGGAEAGRLGAAEATEPR